MTQKRGNSFTQAQKVENIGNSNYFYESNSHKEFFEFYNQQQQFFSFNQYQNHSKKHKSQSKTHGYMAQTKSYAKSQKAEQEETILNSSNTCENKQTGVSFSMEETKKCFTNRYENIINPPLLLNTPNLTPNVSNISSNYPIFLFESLIKNSHITNTTNNPINTTFLDLKEKEELGQNKNNGSAIIDYQKNIHIIPNEQSLNQVEKLPKPNDDLTKPVITLSEVSKKIRKRNKLVISSSIKTRQKSKLTK